MLAGLVLDKEPDRLAAEAPDPRQIGDRIVRVWARLGTRVWGQLPNSTKPEGYDDRKPLI